MECSNDSCTREAKVKGKCRSCYVNDRQKAERAEESAALGPVVCEHCGTEFVPKIRFSDRPNRWCSRQCKDRGRVMTDAERAEMLRRYYLRAYGLTMEQVEEMRSRGCAICGRTEGNGRHGQLHIDHDHVTGRVRGCLCHSCNVALGHFGHDPVMLAKAVAYLG